MWSVRASDGTITRVQTLATANSFSGIDCYLSTGECDIYRASRRITRLFETGDMATLFAPAGEPVIPSSNGRWFVHGVSTSYVRMLDVDAQESRTYSLTGVPHPAGPVAVSDDGQEVDFGGAQPAAVTRFRPAAGAWTRWVIPTQPGRSLSVRDLRWVGGELHALVAYSEGSTVIYEHHRLNGTSAVVGTTPSALNGVSERIAWRPEAGTLLVVRFTDCDYLPTTFGACDVAQYELELVRGGVTRRMARSGIAFPNLVVSPDGRYAAYGEGRVFILELPQ